MVENFSWFENKKYNWKEYVLSHLKVPKVNFTNSFGLGVASNNKKMIEEIEDIFEL